MNRLIQLTCLLAATAIFAAPTTAPRTAPVAPSSEAATPFSIDSVHSTIIYRIRHFEVSYFYGRINKPSGTFIIDESDLAGSSIDITIELKEMDAGNDDRNRFLMSPDFFNAREHPQARFVASSIRKTAEGTFEADGTFEMRGVKKDITVQIDEYTELQTTKFGYRGGFECTFSVDRSDFGMDLFVKEGTLGDEVRITASIEGVRR